MIRSMGLRYILCITQFMILVVVLTIPAYADTLRLKGGYANYSNAVSVENGYMASLEYMFTPNIGLAGQVETYTPNIGAGTTATSNIYYAYATFHAYLNSEDYKEIAILSLINNIVSPYGQIGYAFLDSNMVTGGTTTTYSNSGISYGIGFDIFPQSNICGFVGYRWLTLPSNGGIAYLISGINAGLEIRL